MPGHPATLEQRSLAPMGRVDGKRYGKAAADVDVGGFTPGGAQNSKNADGQKIVVCFEVPIVGKKIKGVWA